MRIETRIFICYSRKDKEKAEALYKMLEGEGLKPYLDIEDIPVGEWRPEVEQAIRKASHFIIFISENSRKSEHVNREVDIAIKVRTANNLEIFPIWISDIKPDDPLDSKVGEYNGIVFDKISPFLLRQKLVDYLSPKRQLQESIMHWLAFVLILPPLIILLSPPDQYKLIFMLITMLIWLAYQLLGFKLRNAKMMTSIVTLLITLTILSGGYEYFGKDKIQAEIRDRRNTARNERIKESVEAITSLWNQLEKIQKGEVFEKKVLDNGGVDFKFSDKVTGNAAIFEFSPDGVSRFVLKKIKYYKKTFGKTSEATGQKMMPDFIALDELNQDHQKTFVTRIIFGQQHGQNDSVDEPQVIHRIQLDLKSGHYLELTKTALDKSNNNLENNIDLLIGDLLLYAKTNDYSLSSDQVALFNLLPRLGGLYGP